jgi:hypothetical protein
MLLIDRARAIEVNRPTYPPDSGYPMLDIKWFIPALGVGRWAFCASASSFSVSLSSPVQNPATERRGQKF